MSAVRVRPKNQITLPAPIVRQSGIHENDVLDVAYANGVITLVPNPFVSSRANARDLARFLAALGMTPDRPPPTLDRSNSLVQ